MKRKCLALLLTLSMVLGNTSGVFAADFTQDITIEDEDADIVDDASYIPDDLGIAIEDENEVGEEIDIVADEAREEADEPEVEVNETNGRELPPSTAFPVKRNETIEAPELYSEASYNADYDEEYYVTPNLPKLRDQGIYGTCWAQAALALAEINLISKGLAPNDVDFSELHMAYFVYNTPLDPLGGTNGDYMELNTNALNPQDIPDGFMAAGGTTDMPEMALASWIGAVEDAVVPYSTAPEVIKNGLPADMAFEDVAHLKNSYNTGISLLNKNTEEIQKTLNAAKRLIVDNGALYIAYDSSMSGKNKDGEYENYYSNENNSFYRPVRTQVNHGVTVVGWDDNFPKDHFNIEAPGNGAWLVRNSWAIEDVDPEYSYYGYFWMSYYEASLQEYAAAYEFDTADNYDHNYQYDGVTFTQSLSADKVANVFTVHGGKGKEVLKAVGIYNANTDSSNKLEIYNLNKDFKNPEDGTLLETVTKELAYEGFATIPLDQELTFDQNESFSVVLTSAFIDPNAHEKKERYYSEHEYLEPYYTTYCYAAADKNQSFVCMDDEWTDYGESNDVNLRIKAFTDDLNKEPDTKEYTIEYKAEPGKPAQNVEYKTKYKFGDEFTFNSPEAPKGYAFKGWYADEALKSPKNGIEKTDKRNITVYAKYDPIDYTLLFDANGGKGSMEALMAQYDDFIFIPEPSYDYAGKYFTEWNTKADGSGDSYSPNEMVMNLTDKEEVVTLYAIWSSDSVDIDTFEFTEDEICLYSNDTKGSSCNAYNFLKIKGKDGKEPSDKSVVWKSSDEKVVKVSEDGVLNAVEDKSKAVRTATITAKNEKANKEATLKVTVIFNVSNLRILDTAKYPKVYGSYNESDAYYPHGDPEEPNILQKGSLSLDVGKSFKFKADFLPKTKTKTTVTENSVAYGEAILNQNVQWTSSNAAIAAVDANGKVTGVSKGNATIYAIAVDNDGATIAATTSVTINEPATGITLSQKSYKLGVNNSVKLSASVLPYNADQNVTWSVQKGKEKIISVDSQGFVTGLSKGKADVIATTQDGKKSAKCAITVGDRYDKIVIKAAGGKDSVAVGKKLNLSVAFTDAGGNPVNPVNKAVEWQIEEGQKNCSISSKGVLTGVDEGIIKVRAISAVDDKIYGEKEIQVYIPLTKASVRDKEITIAPGKSFVTTVVYTTPIKEVVYPTLLKNVEWSLQKTEDSQYVNVKGDGEYVTISALKETSGPVTLQAKFTPYGGKEVTLTCNVAVANKPLKSFKLDKTNIKTNVGQIETVVAQFTPTVPANTKVTWKLDDEKDAEYVKLDIVSEDILVVEAVKATPKGHVIKATATTDEKVNDKALSVTCKITVGEKAGSVNITNVKNDRVDLYEGKTFGLKSTVYADDGKTLSGNQKVIYSSSNANIATVDGKGKITAIREGMAEIYIASKDNPLAFKKVTVFVSRPVTKLTLDKKKVSLYMNNQGKSKIYEIIRPIVTPSDASFLNANVTWTVNDPSKIKWGVYSLETGNKVKTEQELIDALVGTSMVDPGKDGIVTGKGEALAISAMKPGKIKLTATLSNRKKAVCEVTVYTTVSGLRIREANGITLNKSGNYELSLAPKKTVKVNPMVDLHRAPYSDAKGTKAEKEATAVYKEAKKYAKDIGVCYMSDNPAVASVDSKGRIKALGKGEAVIHVRTNEGSFVKKILVTVK